MKKIIKILKDKRGVTLTEIIVGMVMSVIIAAYVAAVIAPMMITISRSNDLAEVNSLLDNISEIMISDFSRASAIKNEGDITISTTYGNVVYSNLSSGVLQRNGEDVFAEDYYKGKTLAIVLSETDSAYELELTVSKNSEELAKRTYAVNPLFLSLQ